MASAVPTSTYDPASTGPTAQPDQASSTSIPIVVSTPQPTIPEASSTAIATSFFAIPPLAESSSVAVADTQVIETPIITAPNVGSTYASALAAIINTPVIVVGSAVVIGSQTISVGGSAVIANSAVVSLGASGIVVQLPGGVQTVIPVPTASASVSSISTAAAVSASTASVGSTASGPASSNTTTPELVQGSAASRINGIMACLSGLLMLGLVYAL